MECQRRPVIDAIAAQRGAGAVLLGLLRPLGADEFAVRDVLESICWHLMLGDEKASVGRLGDSPAEALEEPAEFVR